VRVASGPHVTSMPKLAPRVLLFIYVLKMDCLGKCCCLSVSEFRRMLSGNWTQWRRFPKLGTSKGPDRAVSCEPSPETIIQRLAVNFKVTAGVILTQDPHRHSDRLPLFE
jgi:hypothetical protein